MTQPSNLPDRLKTAPALIRDKVRLVRDAVQRIEDNLPAEELTPGQFAYIDEQASRMIGWLASVRSTCVTEAGLAQAHYGDGTADDVDRDIDAEIDKWLGEPDGGEA